MIAFDNGDLVWNAGDSIIFSIMPISGFDGGEVWVWECGSEAKFLNFGGHAWDTAFDVRNAFGVLSENIDALEVVGTIPEPSGLSLCFASVLMLHLIRSRNRVRPVC